MEVVLLRLNWTNIRTLLAYVARGEARPTSKHVHRRIDRLRKSTFRV